MTGSVRHSAALGWGLTFLFTASWAMAQAGPNRLGRACVDDQDCQDAATPDLQCITETQTLLGSGAPPNGLCTSSCSSDDDCEALSAGSLCYPFEEGSDAGYCIEGCSFGEPPIGEAKCHNRDDFACNPAVLSDTGFPCATTASCEAGELCIDGTCSLVFPGCLPSCRGDLDCPQGRYCDQSFLSGVCVAQKPTGKALGEPCTVPGENEAAEPDECLGFCQADEDGSTSGHCAATCGLATACAYNSESGKFDGACFYASVLTAETGSIGDFGFCTPSCNCTAECNDDALACSLLSQGALTQDFKGPGLCFSPDANTTEYNQCEGAGGSGDGGSGSAGEAGSPAAVGGEPSAAGGVGSEPGSSGGEPGSSGGSRNAGSGGDSRGGTEGGEANAGYPASGPNESVGCGCRFVPSSPAPISAGLLLICAAMLRRRRRLR